MDISGQSFHGTTSSTTLGMTPPVWLWLYFPPVMIIFALAMRLLAPEFYDNYVYGELGIVENATVLFLIPAVILGVVTIRNARILQFPLLTAWLVIQTLGMFYFMGEEASWGQHWFGWSNEGIFENHPRGETNIHNTNHWFDQKPKVLVEIWTIIGGIIVPLLLKYRGKANTVDFRSIWYWAWPTMICLPTAVTGLIVKNVERIREAMGVNFPSPFDIRFSEPQEYYFALFFFLYMFSLYLRVEAAKEQV
ncbi:hypothetical protein GUA87_08955 [Sneathiella sp. P13V-1]|uniref:hypothetical protein n=1 Tax=Sneathiella sp. P13V-1 TaxID=2697366 RepID=UPI00187B66A6|nr:hypothetical protein [Sneathiella sp. P13V-1]MBE7636970.1 hypothetical protein [Sneathiella sp. P13V-1]